MANGLRRTRGLLGDAPGLTDEKIQETLWYYYFDVEQTVAYLLGTWYAVTLRILLALLTKLDVDEMTSTKGKYQTFLNFLLLLLSFRPEK